MASKFPEYKPSAVKTKKAAKGSERTVKHTEYYEPVISKKTAPFSPQPKLEPGK